MGEIGKALYKARSKARSRSLGRPSLRKVQPAVAAETDTMVSAPGNACKEGQPTRSRLNSRQHLLVEDGVAAPTSAGTPLSRAGMATISSSLDSRTEGLESFLAGLNHPNARLQCRAAVPEAWKPPTKQQLQLWKVKLEGMAADEADDCSTQAPSDGDNESRSGVSVASSGTRTVTSSSVSEASGRSGRSREGRHRATRSSSLPSIRNPATESRQPSSRRAMRRDESKKLCERRPKSNLLHRRYAHCLA